MERISEILLNFYHVFAEAPFKFLVFITICSGMYVLYSKLDTILDYFPDPDKENAQFELSLKRDALVNDSLLDSLAFLKAESVSIAQFHNGQYDLTRLPFTKITTTYFVGETELDLLALYSARPLSSMNYTMLEMWANKNSPQCVVMDVKDVKDIPFKQRMENSGKVFVSLCPLTNLRNYPIGYLSVAYGYQPQPHEIQGLLEYQKLLASRVAGYLQDGVVDENRNKAWIR